MKLAPFSPSLVSINDVPSCFFFPSSYSFSLFCLFLFLYIVLTRLLSSLYIYNHDCTHSYRTSIGFYNLFSPNSVSLVPMLLLSYSSFLIWIVSNVLTGVLDCGRVVHILLCMYVFIYFGSLESRNRKLFKIVQETETGWTSNRQELQGVSSFKKAV